MHFRTRVAGHEAKEQFERAAHEVNDAVQMLTVLDLSTHDIQLLSDKSRKAMEALLLANDQILRMMAWEASTKEEA